MNSIPWCFWLVENLLLVGIVANVRGIEGFRAFSVNMIYWENKVRTLTQFLA